MLARLLLTLVTLATFAVSEQTPLTDVASDSRYSFTVIDYTTVRSGTERVSPIYQGPQTLRTPSVYRSTTWSKLLDQDKKAAVRAAAPFKWRDTADSSNSYMEYALPSHSKGYWAFSTEWHILSGQLSGLNATEGFVTVIVPVSLANGAISGLMEFIDVK